MLTEQTLKQIEKDVEKRKARTLAEGDHAGGEDPPGNKPTDNDPVDKDQGQDGGASTEGSIKALAGLNLKERDDFFKLSQILKGLAAVADKDQKAMDFLTQVGEAVKDIAGGEDGGNPKDDKRTDPGDDEPLKGHPKREKGEPGNKASQTDVEKGLPGGEDVDLGEGMGHFMPTGQIKNLNMVSGKLSKLTKKLDSELNRLLDGIQGGIGDGNQKRVARMVEKVIDVWMDMDDLMGVVETNVKQIRSKVKEDVDLGDDAVNEDLTALVLGEMLDDLVMEAKTAEPITGRDWQELRGFADFINKDAARVAKAVASKKPDEILDKAKAMVTNVEILIKRMVGIYPSLSRAADHLDGAGREMLRTMQKGEDVE